MTTDHADLVIIGGNPASLSLAVEAQEAGLGSVLILERSSEVTPSEAVGTHALHVEYHTRVANLRDLDNEVEVELETGQIIHARAVAVADIPPGRPLPPPIDIPATLSDRVHVDVAGVAAGSDVMVVGAGTRAVELTEQLVRSGCHVVLALRDRFEDLSRLSQSDLRRLERDRAITIFFHTGPGAIDDVGGLPMVVFEDRRTPDLQFDHVVFAVGVEVHDDPFALVGVTVQTGPDHVFILQDRSDHYAHTAATVIPAGNAWNVIRDRLFQALPLAPPSQPISEHRRIEELRRQHYNAHITLLEKAHSDLWIIRVRPDTGGAAHRAGQYATLGLGYWEARIDTAREVLTDRQSEKLIRRSYSISSAIFDEVGYLADPHDETELEFYVVLVPPSSGRVPALTPRLALKEPGDRIYLGPKIAGRYTLDYVRDPASTVVFLATGTGEAPHNAMIAELLRSGHYGPIVSVVSTRFAADLGYLDTHRALERRFANYRYLAQPTREPDVPKRYIQELIESGDLEQRGKFVLEPARTHVFLCGNPAMIGPPEDSNGELVFPQPRGVIEVLTGRGFTADRRGAPGNVHFEEYW